jgi:hypothetical protein
MKHRSHSLSLFKVSRPHPRSESYSQAEVLARERHRLQDHLEDFSVQMAVVLKILEATRISRVLREPWNDP